MVQAVGGHRVAGLQKGWQLNRGGAQARPKVWRARFSRILANMCSLNALGLCEHRCREHVLLRRPQAACEDRRRRRGVCFRSKLGAGVCVCVCAWKFLASGGTAMIGGQMGATSRLICSGSRASVSFAGFIGSSWPPSGGPWPRGMGILPGCHSQTPRPLVAAVRGVDRNAAFVCHLGGLGGHAKRGRRLDLHGPVPTLRRGRQDVGASLLDLPGVGQEARRGRCLAGEAQPVLGHGGYVPRDAHTEEALAAYVVGVAAPPPVAMPDTAWTDGSVADPSDPLLARGAWAAVWQEGQRWVHVVSHCPRPQEPRRVELAALVWVALAPTPPRRAWSTPTAATWWTGLQRCGVVTVGGASTHWMRTFGQRCQRTSLRSDGHRPISLEKRPRPGASRTCCGRAMRWPMLLQRLPARLGACPAHP